MPGIAIEEFLDKLYPSSGDDLNEPWRRSALSEFADGDGFAAFQVDLDEELGELPQETRPHVGGEGGAPVDVNFFQVSLPTFLNSLLSCESPRMQKRTSLEGGHPCKSRGLKKVIVSLW